MLGDFVRDKDAVTASLLLTEMVAHYDSAGKTLFAVLDEIAERFGYYEEGSLQHMFPGLNGMETMANIMQALRQNPPQEIGGYAVKSICDYESGQVVDTATGTRTESPLRGSNVLRYTLAGGHTLLVRPSGTEPKLKFYLLCTAATKTEAVQAIAALSTWADTFR